ncbi:MAG TPA: hypothetical protein VFY24_03970 [Azospira sp.]|nr:hypothetical protein [Azospira sp.]
MKTSRLAFAGTLTGLVLIGSAGLAWSQTTGDPVAPTTTTQPATAATPTSKLVSSFSSFAGSEENAASLVNGLRTGSAITLTGAGAGTGTGTGGTSGGTTGGTVGGETTTFTSPTKPMGYGNIRIAMSLAEAQLASQGVTNPTPTQLQGALMGTTTGTGADATTTQGILQMRASGMGWGQIANSMGFKLGPVMSGKQTFTEATTTAAGTTTGSATTARGKSGVTTAGGGSSGKGGVTTAAGGSGGKGGVTTAGGSSGKSGVTTAGGGGGNAYGHGKSSVVTAAGGVGGGGGAVASGLGHGNAGGASAGAVSAAGGSPGGGGGQGGGHGKGGGKP